ncbi:hypothetical protein CR513_44257, partial [Mucuna pruriens]
MSMVEQLEEMCEMIHKLNNQLVAKEAKKKSLEEKVVQLMHNHEEQNSSPPNNNEDHIDNSYDGYVDNAL